MDVALYAPQALERAAAGKAYARHMEQAFIIKSLARLLVLVPGPKRPSPPTGNAPDLPATLGLLVH
ncbi:hypothetical protein JCM17844_18910 [Iodidimonas gelatinilytica]|uniref:Uncharacterized protein n=2 Tax=Iodidimonas gelatinilytica TaxID=1236966 RepID=A0A5A7MRL9_9PROT|nr:hypothetical protein JCM17844_18910 [Iodidimonas gelatinilytica]GER00589.1 hypothetical protein JCM17845_12120 [Iodidimonas gelatinilytica]